MHTLTQRDLLVFGMLFATTSIANANAYTIVDLGPNVNPVAINDSGAVAGTREDPRSRAELLRKKHWHNLSPQSLARAMNQNADVVGEANRREDATIWTGKKKASLVQLPATADSSTARGINNSQLVVGDYIPSTGPGASHCYSSSEGSGALDLGFMEQGTSCFAYAVNDKGQITGEASTTEGGGAARAFIWANNSFTDLGVLGEAISSTGLSINKSGVVVGAEDLDFDDAHAFLWNGTLVDLDPTGSYATSVAVSINDGGGVVGWVQTSSGSQTQAARFAGGEVAKLKDEVDKRAGWDLRTATSINNLGEIVGVGYYKGELHGYKLIPQ